MTQFVYSVYDPGRIELFGRFVLWAESTFSDWQWWNTHFKSYTKEGVIDRDLGGTYNHFYHKFHFSSDSVCSFLRALDPPIARQIYRIYNRSLHDSIGESELIVTSCLFCQPTIANNDDVRRFLALDSIEKQREAILAYDFARETYKHGFITL